MRASDGVNCMRKKSVEIIPKRRWDDNDIILFGKGTRHP